MYRRLLLLWWYEWHSKCYSDGYPSHVLHLREADHALVQCAKGLQISAECTTVGANKRQLNCPDPKHPLFHVQALRSRFVGSPITSPAMRGRLVNSHFTRSKIMERGTLYSHSWRCYDLYKFKVIIMDAKKVICVSFVVCFASCLALRGKSICLRTEFILTCCTIWYSLVLLFI